MEQHLRRLLDELSGAMGRARQNEDREELTRLHSEVERRLADEKERSGLVDALEKAEIRFETDHPTLGEALRDAIEVLSAGGI